MEEDKVKQAIAAWAAAPSHVRVMAGAYVIPLLNALSQLAERVEALEQGRVLWGAD